MSIFSPYIWERVKMNKAELMPTKFGLLKHPPARPPCTVSYSGWKHEGGLFRVSALTKILLRWLAVAAQGAVSVWYDYFKFYIHCISIALQRSVVLEKLPVFSLG